MTGASLPLPPRSVDPATAARAASLGRIIREARAGRYSLEELSQRAGVSAGLLSQIERGRGNPSFATMHKIADALDLRLSVLFQFDEVRARQRLVRKADKKTQVLEQGGLEYEVLTPDIGRKFAVIRLLVHPGFDNSDAPFAHPGEESLHVLAGCLQVFVGAEEFVLNEGDTLSFESSVRHWFRNATDRTVELIEAVGPPPW